jgi:hypothetical protein
MELLRGRRFLLLLIAIGLFLAVYPLLSGAAGGRLVMHVLLTLVFIAAMLAIFAQRRLRVLALLLGVPTLAGSWTGYALPAPPLVAAFHLVSALFLALTVAAILRAILREEAVSADSIYGAFCGYLLMGVAFSHLFCALESMSPTSFQDRGVLGNPAQPYELQYAALTYFSLMTLTTVGYGDVVPASREARGLVVIEAVLGQFYIAVLVAELIGMRVSQAHSGPRP